ncbi:Concanavalin A-like lectin/glucanases superfamily [Penicillium expansum]|uniref:Concanavalin A-like lectin/glucanases superfamily n=1 Tax=Penicillium expansum TaxID=27334 RepID=A0A0A2JAX0_PENEN|nr:Concanavalin A-like lectin/glucanases superfamily [Penicillium expansum]KGO51768.1 Concanavalin A-like lectin/glucanases superfamily [Penicillium expansum]
MASELSVHEYYQIQARFPTKESNPDDGVNRKVFVRQDIDEWSGKKSWTPKKDSLTFKWLQVVYDIMIKEIIPQFQEAHQSSWREQAESWRLPFWDWARNGRVPDLAKYPTITVPRPEGGSVRINNPLFQFRMPTDKPMQSEGVGTENTWENDTEQEEYKNFGNAIGTSRWPDEEDQNPNSEGWRHGVVNNRKVADAFNSHEGYNDKNHGPAAEMVYRLLTVPMDYTTFASTNPTSKDQNVDEDLNIEYIHNNVNIDRLFAIWQALNPDKWMDNIPTDNTTIRDSFGKEHPVNGNTPLQPFRRDSEGNYWTPEGIRFPSNLGYSYPELLRWETRYRQEDGTLNQILFKENIIAIINRLYGVSRDLALDPKAPIPEGLEAIDGGLKIPDFAFSVRFLKYALGGQPFWVKLYLAQEDGIQTPLTDLIAEVYNFSQKPELDGSSVCGNCTEGQKSRVKSTAYIPITPVLYKLIRGGRKLKSLTRDEVLEYIRKRAYWRNEKELPRYEVEKLELEIIGSSNDTKHFTNPATPPAFENFKKEPTITGGADGALDPELKQAKIDPPAPRPKRPRANLPLHGILRFQQTLKADSVILLESSSVDPVKPDNGIDMTQISIMDAENDTIFHISIRRAQGQIIFNAKFGGSWGEEERIDIDRRFNSEDGATILIHDQGDGFEVSIDWVHAIWFAKRAHGRTPQSIWYDIGNKEGTSALSEDLEVRTYPSMKALFLQKHAHEEEK